MQVLIDTHVFIWWVSEPQKLSPLALNLYEDPANTIFLSLASLWELQIKVTLGKLTFPASVQFMAEDEQIHNGLNFLSIRPKHIWQLATLPYHHRDPFDRLIIAQAISEGLPLITDDGAMRQYANLQIIW